MVWDVNNKTSDKSLNSIKSENQEDLQNPEKSKEVVKIKYVSKKSK